MELQVQPSAWAEAAAVEGLETAGSCWGAQALAVGVSSVHPLWAFRAATGALFTAKDQAVLRTHWLSGRAAAPGRAAGGHRGLSLCPRSTAVPVMSRLTPRV